jgi:hypothetical protein
MTPKTYSIFGAGASGLYTAWRLLSGSREGKANAKLLTKGDLLELFDWGQYDFSKEHSGSRAAGARVCTWHFNDDPTQAYLELGGMRYSFWNSQPSKDYPDPNDGMAPGHRLVTTVINQLGLDQYSVPFNESNFPLYYLRSKNFYLSDINSNNPAPYNVDHFGAAAQPDQGFAIVEALSVTSNSGPQTRAQWDDFFRHGTITAQLPESSIFKKGDHLKDIGYWNLLYDQLGSEGFNYAADGNGYTSNVINWNSAVAFQANNEFTPGNQYKTITTGYSGMFNALFDAIVKLAEDTGVHFAYRPNTRLHSILQGPLGVNYAVATREQPWTASEARTCSAAWLAMPRAAIELVAQATRYQQPEGLDVLNHPQVQLYLESAIMQPSYKVGMFFETPWWLDSANPAPPYPPKLTGYVITPEVIEVLHKKGFPAAYLAPLQTILNQPYDDTVTFIKAVETSINHRLTVAEETQVTTAATRNTIGPSVTDTPIRQVVYFGNNATGPNAKPVYGLLASYDDEQFTTFWQELELEPNQQRKRPISENIQPLKGPRRVPERMVKMLRKQLAELHFGPNSDYSAVPLPLEAKYMDWSLPPFNAGYHVWAAHYNIDEVQQKIRKPSQLIPGQEAEIYIVGETYSNDQAWVEGAYCTAESVLNDFFGIPPIIDNTNYPFICGSNVTPPAKC